jgi:hypothetical protein
VGYLQLAGGSTEVTICITIEESLIGTAPLAVEEQCAECFSEKNAHREHALLLLSALSSAAWRPDFSSCAGFQVC